MKIRARLIKESSFRLQRYQDTRDVDGENLPLLF